MKNRLLKTFTSLVLTVLMVISVMPAFAITIGAAETTYTFKNYIAGTQYANGEEHVLDETLTVTVNGGHFTTELRIYKGTNVVLTSQKGITSLTLNAGNGAYTLIVYGSNDGGNTWTKIQDVSTKKAYADYEVDLSASTYKVVKLEASGGQIRLNYMTIQYENNCSHTNTEEVAEVPATCTTPGTAAGVKCSDCEEIISGCNVIPATGHTDANNDYTCDVCDAKLCAEHTYKYEILTEATCTTAGEKQQVCSNCGEVGEKLAIPAKGHTEVVDVEAKDPTCTEKGNTKGSHCSVCNEELSTSNELSATGVHIYVDGKCTMCDKAKPYFFQIGDVVIFTGSKADGTTYELTGFESGYGIASVYTGTPTGKFPITVVAGSQNNTFAFKFGDYYITRNAGNIGLSTELNDDASWKVELDSSDNLVIKSYSGNTYKLQYNANSPRFKTYTSNQQPIKVVKYSGPIIKTFGLSLNEGVTVKVTYNIPEAWLTAKAGTKVVFSNGESFDAKSGENVYSVKLTPAQINDDLTVKIQLADGSEYGATNNVSVSAYKAKSEAAGKSAELIALLDAALTYSNAADGTIVEELTETFTGVADYEVLHAKEDDKLFAGFSGQLGKDASIYINVNTANVQEGETLILTVGGKEIINGNIADYITKDKQIVITGLYPATFNDIIYIEVSTEGSNATFTFNSYLKAIYNDNSSTQQVKNLAVATYLYGLAAEAYLTAQ